MVRSKTSFFGLVFYLDLPGLGWNGLVRFGIVVVMDWSSLESVPCLPMPDASLSISSRLESVILLLLATV